MRGLRLNSGHLVLVSLEVALVVLEGGLLLRALGNGCLGIRPQELCVAFVRGEVLLEGPQGTAQGGLYAGTSRGRAVLIGVKGLQDVRVGQAAARAGAVFALAGARATGRHTRAACG